MCRSWQVFTIHHFILTLIKRLFGGLPGDTSLHLLAVAKKTSFPLCIPNWNKAAVILTLLTVQHLFSGSWSHHLGKQCRGKTKQVTPLAMPSLLVPQSVYKLREANHNFTLWFVKSHSSTGGTEKTFKSINFMVYRITAFHTVPLVLCEPSLYPSLQRQPVLQMKREAVVLTKTSGQLQE